MDRTHLGDDKLARRATFGRKNTTNFKQNVRQAMGSVNPKANSANIPLQHRMEIRVRYKETDAQGHVHHSNYLNYFEVARTEMLRSSGKSYRNLEAEGIMLVVVKAVCDYKRGAKYDDILTVDTRLIKAKGTRIVHRYELSLIHI